MPFVSSPEVQSETDAVEAEEQDRGTAGASLYTLKIAPGGRTIDASRQAQLEAALQQAKSEEVARQQASVLEARRRDFTLAERDRLYRELLLAKRHEQRDNTQNFVCTCAAIGVVAVLGYWILRELQLRKLQRLKLQRH